MTILSKQKLQFIEDLYRINVIKLGQFQLKSGMDSPIYIDLRQLISYPNLLSKAARLLWQTCCDINFDFVCGIPYAALPMATCLALQQNIPMIMCRKEKKAYGTQKQIEGCYAAGQTCLIIEDVITSGTSVLETLAILAEHHIQVQHVAVLIDRGQGGQSNLQQHNLKLHAALTLTDIFNGLFQQHLLTEHEIKQVEAFRNAYAL